nr:MAG TPA: hypothetical protein [Caudoviricetes sp.]
MRKVFPVIHFEKTPPFLFLRLPAINNFLLQPVAFIPGSVLYWL